MIMGYACMMLRWEGLRRWTLLLKITSIQVSMFIAGIILLIGLTLTDYFWLEY